MAEATIYFVVDVETGSRRPVIQKDMDIDFPNGVRGWGDVLDCRHSPYEDLALSVLLERAHDVHKHYVLVAESQLSS